MQDVDIGKKVHEYRLMREMSSRELSRLVDISPSMLSQIENSQANPSLNTLKSIAQVLNVPLYRFFQGEEQMQAVSPVVKRNERKTMGYPEQNEIVYELLMPDTNGSIEFCMMHLSPDVASSDKMLCHSGEEMACVISGQANIIFEDQCYTLEQGDSVRIAPKRQHRWENCAKETTTIIFAVSPPSF